VRIVDNLRMPDESPYPALHWDIFCRVIDNFGDIGVCWRLACNLAQRGQSVRLWVDDASALTWMAPLGAPGVDVRAWTTPIDLTDITPGDALVEAFGCEINPEFIAAYAMNIRDRGQKSIWINLEYLSAEAFTARCHGLLSPVMHGPGAGLTKYFFYPGFAPGTGGLLRETDVMARQAKFDRNAWLTQQGVNWQGERLLSLFCYEPADLAGWLDDLAGASEPTCLLVTHGRASAAVHTEVFNKNRLQPLWNKRGSLSFFYLPQLTQTDYDHLLWASDVNFVRGEDSLVRALWAGKPFVWQIYPQDDAAHEAKLDAFLDWLHAPASMRAFHHLWNGVKTANAPSQPVAFEPKTWQTCVLQARAQLLSQDDLVTQLLGFTLKKPLK
jgi:uncharacterized repeat protein (TIGR03837 family)